MPRLVACFFMFLVTFVAPGSASASPGFIEFRLGFASLAGLIPDTAGQPLEDEHYGANGDSLQRTTTGLMVWRKADNWTAFTDGATTWINGPAGLQSRPNEERFDWEGGARTLIYLQAPASAGLASSQSLLNRGGIEEELMSVEMVALDLINRSRAESGLAPASMDEKLRAVARAHARDMADRGYFGHYSPEGAAPWDRVKAAAISFKWVAENLGWGVNQSSVAESIRANHLMMMRETPPGDAHRQAILDPQAKRVGIGLALAPGGKVLYVCDFAD